jgi:hypothetical protein
MSEIVTINEDKFEILGLGTAYSGFAFILKKIDTEHYTHVTYDMLDLFNLNYLKRKFNKEQIKYKDLDYLKNSFYKFNEDYNYRIIYKIGDNIFVDVFDNKTNEKEYELKLEDLIKTEDSFYILENFDKHNVRQEYKPLIYKNEERKDILDYNTDYEIIKNLDCKLYLDVFGILRFRGKELSEIEKKMDKDLNQAWFDFYENKYTLKELMFYYINDEMSVNGFMECFYGMFVDVNEEFASPELIIDILSGKVPPFDK